MLAQPWGPFRADLDHPKASIHTLNRFNLCPSSLETRRFVERGVRELVRTFPEIGMLGFKFSDEGGELICGRPRCGNWPYLDRFVEYSWLIIETARRENPGIRFMSFIHGVNWWIPLAQPAYEGRQADALVNIQRRMGDAFDAMMMLRSTPTGGDLQSRLHPQSTLLGRGVPLFFFFHSYEAGGPGLVAPLLPVLSHLSWPLPVYLSHLQEYLAPGQGMIGGARPVAGMEVAWWHPDLDARACLRNWCRARYGEAAGAEVHPALLDTHRITEAFLRETKPDAAESFTLYRWRPENYLQPYAGDLTLLKTLAPDGVTAAAGLAPYDFMVPQAKQPESLATAAPGAEGS